MYMEVFYLFLYAIGHFYVALLASTFILIVPMTVGGYIYIYIWATNNNCLLRGSACPPWSWLVFSSTCERHLLSILMLFA